MHLIKSWHFIRAFLQEPRSGENFKNSIGIADISLAGRENPLENNASVKYIYIKGGEERNKRRGGEMIFEIVEGREEKRKKKKEKKRVSDLTIKSQLFTFV